MDDEFRAKGDSDDLGVEWVNLKFCALSGVLSELLCLDRVLKFAGLEGWLLWTVTIDIISESLVSVDLGIFAERFLGCFGRFGGWVHA